MKIYMHMHRHRGLQVFVESGKCLLIVAVSLTATTPDNPLILLSLLMINSKYQAEMLFSARSWIFPASLLAILSVYFMDGYLHVQPVCSRALVRRSTELEKTHLHSTKSHPVP